MNRHQRTALDNHCRLSIETMRPEFGRVLPSGLAMRWDTMKEYASFTGLAGEQVTVRQASAAGEPSVWLVGDRGGDNNGALRLNAAHAFTVRDALTRWLEDVGAERTSHVIEFREDGWTILHPLACRPKLFDCPVNRVAERELTEPPDALGRFECELNDLGDRLLIGDRVEDGGQP